MRRTTKTARIIKKEEKREGNNTSELTPKDLSFLKQYILEFTFFFTTELLLSFQFSLLRNTAPKYLYISTLLKAVLNIASPTWRRPTWRNCLRSFPFVIWTKRVHPAVLTKRFGDLQKGIPTFIFIFVTGIRWISQRPLIPAKIQWKVQSHLQSVMPFFFYFPLVGSPRVHVHLVGMLRFTFLTWTNRACPINFLFCSCVYFCLYGPFNCISFCNFSRQLSTFSLCSSGLISASWVLSTTYLFMKVSSSPDIILCGWLGLKHQLTN